MAEDTPPSDARNGGPPAKRKAGELENAHSGRPVKRRASKACKSCRARKVRCDLVLQQQLSQQRGEGRCVTCTNCALDSVVCETSESKRRRKWANKEEIPDSIGPTSISSRKLASRASLDGLQHISEENGSRDLSQEHVPHSIYQTHGAGRPDFGYLNLAHHVAPNVDFAELTQSPLSNESCQSFIPYPSKRTSTTGTLPNFLKPLPFRIGPDEIAYLDKKGALTLPNERLRNELLRAFIEFVYPYMPCINLHDFIEVVEHSDGSAGKVSLILYQAVMFAGSAFVGMEHLENEGYMTRKEARKDFFQRTRLLYDFDYDSDRLSLVQALLLLTYYYETPDDQKDTWHWMGVATSLAYTIGIHRNPEKSAMDAKRVKLWKRIWWSAYMRDRQIALGMRRPTRIKDEDFDVPMLTMDDFELAAVPEWTGCVPADCAVARNVSLQRQLALMCIEKAKLSLCISHILSKQYCVLNNNQGMPQDRTTMMLLPKKLDPTMSDVKACDDELQDWLEGLPMEAQYQEGSSGSASIDLNRSLLHMMFYTTLSALHRPQVIPSPAAGASEIVTPTPPAAAELLDVSRIKVRTAAASITDIAQRLDSMGLARFLPTTGVTALLPALIQHLLDIRSPNEAIRQASLHGFGVCMLVMGKLRDLYAAADYGTAFLEAALRKSGISLPSDTAATLRQRSSAAAMNPGGFPADMTVPPSALFPRPHTLTPPPDGSINPHNLVASNNPDPTPLGAGPVTDDEVARRLETFLASTPPASDVSGVTTSVAPSALSLYPDDDHKIDPALMGPGDGFLGGAGAGAGGGAHEPVFFPANLMDMEFEEFDGLLNLEGSFSFGTAGMMGEAGGVE